MALIRQVVKVLRLGRLYYRLGYTRVWLQSRLFPVSRGRFPPVWMAVRNAFPSAWKTDERPHGLLSIGGTLTEDLLLTAYSKGVHPLCDQRPIHWVVFNPRMVLLPEKAKTGTGVRSIIRAGCFKITFDTAFEEVVRSCGNREHTWITPDRINVAVALHKKGQAHSVEVWNADGRLVGGLFGVAMGRVYIGESAFSKQPDAMKVAFAYLNCHLQHWGYELHDAQVYSRHLELMGFEEISCRDFVRRIQTLMNQGPSLGPWVVDEDLDIAGWDPSKPSQRLTAKYDS